MSSMKRQKDTTPEDELQGQNVPNTLLGKSEGQLRIAPERRKPLGQSRNDTQLWTHPVVKAKSDAVKNNTAREP